MVQKAFNIREGWGRADDWLPPRVLDEALPDGPGKGSFMSEEELNLMLDDYYQARGWTPDGLIPQGKLKDLGLDETGKISGALDATKIRGL